MKLLYNAVNNVQNIDFLLCQILLLRYTRTIFFFRRKVLIPNAQLYVIPYPPQDAESWKLKLFITASSSIMWTALTLVIGAVIMVKKLKTFFRITNSLGWLMI
jgi:hypothetical protein